MGVEIVSKKHTLAYFIVMSTLLLSLFSVFKIEHAYSYVAYVYVNPNEYVVDSPDNIFIVNVSIYNVLDLYGYEFKLFYNSSILNGSQVIEGQFLKTAGEDAFFWVVAFDDHYNSTHGIVWVDSCLIGDILGANGNGTLVTIEFKSLAVGSSQLCLSDVKLVDSKKNPIPCQSTDGSVTVIPEITLPFVILTFCLLIYLSIFIKRKMHYKTNQIKENSGFEIRQINAVTLWLGEEL